MKSLAKVTIVAASLILSACSSDSNNIMQPEMPTVTPPSFNISSVNAQFADGTDGIQFFARPSKDISLIRVEVTNPLNNGVTVNAGGEVFLTDEVMELQDTGFIYFRVSGSWKFRFVGNLEPGKEAFDVTQSVNVSAKTAAR
ncbi:MAG: hypothetical protein ACE5G1_04270 [bacterium]